MYYFKLRVFKVPLWNFGLISVVIILLSGNPLFSQNYGLSFFSHNELKEQRTELNLSPKKAFKFKDSFSISFDLKLHSNPGDKYGYILRIVKNENHNIDIVYNINDDNDQWYFYLISGQHITEIPIRISGQTIFQNWVTFNLELKTDTGTATLSALDSLSTSINISSQDKDLYRIMFGACNYGVFKTRDVPPMNVKDIKIYDKTKLVYHWPLGERSGIESKDVLRRRTATVRNPDWLKPKHEDWVEIYNTKHSGNYQVAVNYSQEIVYIIGKDQLIAFSMSDNSYEIITYNNSPELLDGCQAIYSPADNSIYSYVVDDQSFSSFNLSTRKWNINIPENKAKTIYLHHNKYFSPSDSSLYIFGGYGQHEYKNSIQKCNLNKGQWEFLEADGDFYAPRYLAASGSMADTIYFLGGYGSPSGDQMLNPQHYYHMMAYAMSTQKIVRKFDINIQLREICFSNSMVLNNQTRDYYALAFPLFSDEGYLQLVKGSLDSPDLELMGAKLPYRFHDTKSYSDLFHFPNSNKLVAYTSFLDDEQSTKVQLYSLLFPPNIAPEIKKTQVAGSFLNSFLIIGFTVIVIGSVLFLIIYIRRRKGIHAIPEVESNTSMHGDDLNADITTDKGLQLKSCLLFFGGFQVYDKNGIDITGKFTPLLKELFLLIWLHTLKNNKGISSERMTEILWFDKSASSARNNKAVNIAKLRTVLDEIGSCEVTHKTGYWKIICDEEAVYNDYREFQKITGSKNILFELNIKRLIEITEKGAFLLNLHHDWLDDFKASISETLIETLYAFAEQMNIKDNAGLVIQIADCIFSCDNINEEAMILKCKAQHEMGSHSLSKSTYTKFCKDYLELYDQDYEKSFADITNKPLAEIVNL